jgi:hypothetical protein
MEKPRRHSELPEQLPPLLDIEVDFKPHPRCHSAKESNRHGVEYIFNIPKPAILSQRRQLQNLPKIILCNPEPSQQSETPANQSVNANDKFSIISNLAGTPRISRLIYLRNRMLKESGSSLFSVPKSKPEGNKRKTLMESYDFSSAFKKSEKGQQSKSISSVPKEKSSWKGTRLHSPTKSTFMEQYIFQSKANKQMDKLIQKHKEEVKSYNGTLPLLFKLPKSHTKNPYTQSLMKPMMKSLGKRVVKMNKQASKK